MSCSIAFRRSPNPGALTAATLRPPRSLLTTSVASASPSTSSAIMTSGLVLQRYVDYLSARVAGLGGNPDQIMPSPTGVPAPRPARREFSGKVCEVIYDCFGDLEGFVLCTCDENKHLFRTRENAIGEIALRALRDRLLLSVYADRKDLQIVKRIVIRA
jgi:hypothetical protein